MSCDLGEMTERLENEQKRKKGWRMNCDVSEATKGWRMSCDVGKATGGLQNEFWRT